MTTLTEFAQAARQIMTNNGIGENSLFISVEHKEFKHLLIKGCRPQFEYKALVWVDESANSKLESFISSNPVTAIEKMKIYFEEQKLNKSAIPQPEFIITESETL